MEPKYKIGDEIWFNTEDGLQSGEISGIQKNLDYWEYSIAEVRNGGYLGITYPEIKHYYRPEMRCFPSKEALLVHLSDGLLTTP